MVTLLTLVDHFNVYLKPTFFLLSFDRIENVYKHCVVCILQCAPLKRFFFASYTGDIAESNRKSLKLRGNPPKGCVHMY